MRRYLRLVVAISECPSHNSIAIRSDEHGTAWPGHWVVGSSRLTAGNFKVSFQIGLRATGWTDVLSEVPPNSARIWVEGGDAPGSAEHFNISSPLEKSDEQSQWIHTDECWHSNCTSQNPTRVCGEHVPNQLLQPLQLLPIQQPLRPSTRLTSSGISQYGTAAVGAWRRSRDRNMYEILFEWSDIQIWPLTYRQTNKSSRLRRSFAHDDWTERLGHAMIWESAHFADGCEIAEKGHSMKWGETLEIKHWRTFSPFL